MRTPSVPAAALVLLAALGGCEYSPHGRCTADSDCPTGQICTGGVCAAGVVSPPGRAPIAVPDTYPLSVAASNNTLRIPAPGVLSNDTDPDGKPITAEKVSDPSYGIVFLARNGSFVYVPVVGYLGTDTFTYRASDGVLRSAVTTVTVTVGP